MSQTYEARLERHLPSRKDLPAAGVAVSDCLAHLPLSKPLCCVVGSVARVPEKRPGSVELIDCWLLDGSRLTSLRMDERISQVR